MKRLIILNLLLITVFSTAFSQKKAGSPDKNVNKGVFKVHKNDFWDKVEKEALEYRNPKTPETPAFRVDMSGLDLPKSVNEFKTVPHITPINQGWTGTCWCFSSTSFFESEIKRLYNKDIDLSELHTVYWEYVEKARRFVRERGNSNFGEGSEANATIRILKQYGAVPADSYTGKQEGQIHHDHVVMFDELNAYLQGVKSRNEWNEEVVVETVKSILNHYLGVPPSTIIIEGVKMTPQEYLQNIAKLNLGDYVDILSMKEFPYWKKAVYPAADNWWKNGDYYNVPLDVFMESIKNAVKAGYSMTIGGDVSEAGYDSETQVAIIPSFDIPSDYINDDARQFRWSNGTTGDDHAIHLIGWKQDKNGAYWFLIKDSGSGAQNGPNKGYYFYHEDYVKLKMMSFLVHKEAVKDILKKFNTDETKK
jgi:bleomycin hydrolase